MTAKLDETLMEISAQYAYPVSWDGSVPFDTIRAKTNELRAPLKGKHSEAVMVHEETRWRHFVPAKKAEGLKQIIVYIHGGGWCNCDPYTHGSIMTDLAALSGCELFGLRYPLAPENPYPAALDVICDDIVELYKEQGCEIVIGGDSAGANLALAAVMRLRDEGKDLPISAMLLWYGCYRPVYDTRSHKAYGNGEFGLPSDIMRQFWQHYLGSAKDTTYADLTNASFDNLPPAYIFEAECDCLADDSRWLAGKLVEAGIRHQYDTIPGTNHGFLHYTAVYGPSHETVATAAWFVRLLNERR